MRTALPIAALALLLSARSVQAQSAALPAPMPAGPPSASPAVPSPPAPPAPAPASTAGPASPSAPLFAPGPQAGPAYGGTYSEPYAPPFVQPGVPDEVIVMPPGFLERPGRFPRILPMTDRRAPIPVGYHLGREPRRPLWVAGTAIFAAAHAITGLTAGGLLADTDDEQYGLLFLPVLGPVVWSGAAHGLGSADDRVLFAGMSLVTAIQGVGFGLMLAGFSFPRRVFVRNDVASLDAQLRFSIRPGGLGLAVDF